jgi:hypothetical protein
MLVYVNPSTVNVIISPSIPVPVMTGSFAANVPPSFVGAAGAAAVNQVAVSSCHSVVSKFQINSLGTAPQPTNTAFAHVPLIGWVSL